MASWAIVAVVAVVMAGVVLMVQIGRGGANSKEKASWEQRFDELEQKNQALQHRVEILERVITDRGFELDQSIRNLG
ncbi:hypothetical protein [Ferrimonas marina]|uniref:Phage shock protein B n=1 Tax=Ferrimonas marina TaxID=299255 RepID=A0A1M5X2H1_9GAMM|nr:hypothetical protein [Ferrimonas marina]SHH93413.1 hypothetical protein SAMN02745129_3134 [Ferrimonas marina]